MTEPKWTPGPWEIRPVKDGREWMILGGGGDKKEYVCSITLKLIGCPIPALEEWIIEKRKAGVHLIAAAPDLYEACEAAYRYLNRLMTHTREQATVFALVREALRKARGEEVKPE